MSRLRLTELVCQSRWAKLVLVRAAAGFGKTTAMDQVRASLESASRNTVWLTLERSDNDASRFLARLDGALAVLEEASDEATYPSNLHQPTVGHLALSVTSRWSKVSAPFVMFMDDFEVIEDSGVLRLVQELIHYLPGSSQLVIATRKQPALKLGKLRAAGQLLELDDVQLRFSMKETADFLHHCRGIVLEQAELSNLHGKTEGWAAGVWLAALALAHRPSRAEFISHFSGSDRSVADYLSEDVLDSQSSEIRTFLLTTSLLKILTGPLCDALTERSDSDRVLRKLTAANVLLTRVDDTSETYQYHSLFREFLQTQLQREYPRQIPEFHTRASSWYAKNGRPIPAIEHALQAKDYPLVLGYLSVHASDVLSQGRSRLLDRWLGEVPPACLHEFPELIAIHVWAVAFTKGAGAAQALLERSGLQRMQAPSIQAHLGAQIPLLLAMQDRNEESLAIGLRRLTALPSHSPFADTMLLNLMASLTSVMGSREDSHALLDQARRIQTLSVGEFSTMFSEVTEGLTDLQEGRLRQATARFRMGTVARADAQTRPHNGYALAGIWYATSIYESNDVDLAAHLLHFYVPLIRDLGMPTHLIAAYRLSARISFVRGDADSAFQTVTELEYLGHRKCLPRVVASAKLERARLQLLQGHHGSSREELSRADSLGVWERLTHLREPANDVDYMAMGLLRWEITAGDANGALVDIDMEVEHATSMSRQRRVLHLQLLKCLGLHKLGKTSDAHRLLDSVLRSANKEGYCRMILDEGEAASHLMRGFLRRFSADARIQDPIFFDYAWGLANALGVAFEAAPPNQGGEPGVDEISALTSKEVQILTLLSEGYSNGSIAEKLYISVSTVRTHLRNINSKFHTNSRTQAIAAGRKRGLLR